MIQKILHPKRMQEYQKAALQNGYRFIHFLTLLPLWTLLKVEVIIAVFDSFVKNFLML